MLRVQLCFSACKKAVNMDWYALAQGAVNLLGFLLMSLASCVYDPSAL